MRLIEKAELEKLLCLDSDDGVYVDPILDDFQIGEVTLDLRLGYDFMVFILSRRPSVPLLSDAPQYADISTFYQFTRRDLGDAFVLYPGQIALSTTLEHIGLPSRIYADILGRSSLTRLGIPVNTMVQPGFRGVFSLELMNFGTNPVELVVGGRIVQARMFEVGAEHEYLQKVAYRKYYGDVRPRLSAIQRDADLERLARIA